MLLSEEVCIVYVHVCEYVCVFMCAYSGLREPWGSDWDRRSRRGALRSGGASETHLPLEMIILSFLSTFWPGER